MADVNKRVQVTFDGNSDGIVAAMARAENAVQTQTRLISGHFSQLSSTVNRVIGIVGTMSAVLAGGAAFKGFIAGSQQWTGETLKLAKALGTTTEEAGAWKVAAHSLAVDQEVVENASMKLSRTVATNAGAFDRLGIQVKDTRTGALLPMTQIIQNTSERLNELEPGVNRNAAASLLFGRSWKDSMGILKLTGEAVAEGKKELQELGLEVGPERVKQFLQYRTEVKYMGLVYEALKVQVGNQLMPALISLGQWFKDIAPAGLFVFGGALKGVVTFVEYATLGVTTLWETWKALWGQFSVTSISLVQIITQIISGDFSGAWQTAKKGIADFGSYGVQWFDNIDAASKRTNERVAKLWGITAQTAKKAGPQHQGDQFDTANPTDTHARQMGLEEARLKALLEGYKMRQQAIKDNEGILVAEEEYWLKSGIDTQAQFKDRKYQIEKQGLEDTIGIINEEIAAIEESRKKKSDLAANDEERGKVEADAKRETTVKLTERQKLYDGLRLLQLRYLTDEAAQEKAWKDEWLASDQQHARQAEEMNRQAMENTRGLVAQTYEARLQYLGLEDQAVAAHYANEAMKLEEDYQRKLAYARQLGADSAAIDQEYAAQRLQMENQKAQALANVWWNSAQNYIGYAQQMTTMGLQMLLFDEDQRSQIGKRMLATSLRFLGQGLQQFMFSKAKEHVFNAAAAAGRTTTDAAAATANLTMLEAQATAWAAFYSAMAMNPFGGQAYAASALAMDGVAAVIVPGALAAVGVTGAASVGAEIGMAAAWTAGGILAGSLGEAGASAIEGGTTRNSAGYGGGTPSSPVVTQPVTSPPQQSATINIKIGNLYGEDKARLARWLEDEIAPLMVDASSRKVTFIS